MAAVCSLAAMTLWGMLLALGYQFFLAITEGLGSVAARAAAYLCGGLVCFFSTALFLFALNHGEWGLYGFLFTVFGFYLYHRFLWRKGKVFSAGSVGVAAAVGGGVKKGFGAVLDLAALPFGKIVDKGVTWRQNRSLKKEKRKTKEKTE